MRLRIEPSGFSMWLSPADTYSWARGEFGNGSWPCSQLRDRRVFVCFDRGGLCDLALDSGRGEQDCDSNELTACVGDFLADKLPADNPAAIYFRKPSHA